MVAMMVVTIAVGTAMDMTSTILILTPVFMPLVKAAGIDPVCFGASACCSCRCSSRHWYG